jgi:hypothetical protein
VPVRDALGLQDDVDHIAALASLVRDGVCLLLFVFLPLSR